MRLIKYNDEVFYAADDIVQVDIADIIQLKEKGNNNKIRICTHKSINDDIHEMIIVHHKDYYVRPHKHLNKAESFHIIDGEVNIIIFDDNGGIIKIIKMGNYLSGNKFYYRLPKAYYHTLFIKSKTIVFHEITKGPFKKEDTIFAPWSPIETNNNLVRDFMKMLSKEC